MRLEGVREYRVERDAVQVGKQRADSEDIFLGAALKVSLVDRDIDTGTGIVKPDELVPKLV